MKTIFDLQLALGVATTGALLLESATAQELSIQLSPNQMPQISWAASDSTFVLETADRLDATAWKTLASEPSQTTVSGNLRAVVEIPAQARTAYFRLRRASNSTPPTPTSHLAFDIGNPVFTDLYVDPARGNDENDGSTRERAFRTLQSAWRSLPAGTQTRAHRIRLLPGTHRGAYLEDRQGTHQFPILIEPADGPGTVLLRPTAAGDSGSLQFIHCSYTYVQDFQISVDGGDGLHWESCDHVLARRMRISSRRTDGQDETVKANQSQHVYLEDCDISDAGDNCIDVVAVQYGHIARCKIHNCNDWGAYLKGGSAYWVVEGNEIYDCGTGGFTAGQGSGFQFMVPPWIHYEAYDIKVVNNLIHHCEGAGLGVNGGYNILMAHNTLYRVGSRSHAIEVVHGRRGCDGGDVARCAPLLEQGGWGVLGEEEQYIPNKNILIANNVLYNPAGFRSEYQHFEIRGGVTPPAQSNVPNPARADEQLVVRGNIIWNGPADMLLGIEEDGRGCQSPECNAAQLRADNAINTILPQLRDPAAGDFRPVPGGSVATATAVPLPRFTWHDAPQQPSIPPGNLDNTVARDRSGQPRPTTSAPGALLP